MKTVIITGATRGIGAAISRKFAKEGYAVGAIYRNDDEAAQALISELAKDGAFVHAVKADISDPDQCMRAIEQIRRVLGSPCVLVNNAGTACIAPLVAMSDEEISHLVDADLKGAIYMTKYALPDLAENRGSIVNVSSIWGRVGASCESVYSAAKGGIVAFTLAMAKELAPSGVRVNCVAPGVIDTEMNAGLTSADRRELEERIPLGRMGTADEVASAVLWLAGEQSAYVSGQCLGVDGGFCG